MRKKVLSIILLVCLAMTVLPGAVMAYEEGTDYNIVSVDLDSVQTALADIAEVTKDETSGVITIKLTSDVSGRIRFDNMSGEFILDLNGHTVDPVGSNEAICLDNYFKGAVTITGTGVLKKGRNNIIYNWRGTLNFAVSEGKDYFTLKDGTENIFDEENTTTREFTSVFTHSGVEFVLTQRSYNEPITFDYAYDVQRYPAFPEYEGATVELSRFTVPLNRQENRYSSSVGKWTLTRVCTCGEKDDVLTDANDYLDGIVSRVADNYDLSEDGKNGIVIHKMTDENDELVGYGVVIGADKTNGYTLFVCDLWDNSGAGYVLSETEITEDTVIFNTEQIVQSIYSVSLFPDTIRFGSEWTGYYPPMERTGIIENIGNINTGELTISLSGGNNSAFIVDKTVIDDIPVGGTETFNVVPREGLPAGTYTETVIVKGATILPQTVSVSFSVMENYDIWCAGVEFTSENLVIDENDNPQISGSATYDPATTTITLDNFRYEGPGEFGEGEGIVLHYLGGEDITIQLNGENRIKSVCNDQICTAMYLIGNVTIKGPGSLVAESEGYYDFNPEESMPCPIYAPVSLKIQDASVTAISYTDVPFSFGVFATALELDNANVIAKGYAGAFYPIGDGENFTFANSLEGHTAFVSTSIDGSNSFEYPEDATVEEHLTYKYIKISPVTAEWSYAQDAGFYNTEDGKVGILRFLFDIQTKGTVTETGIKYIKADNITQNLAGAIFAGASETGNASTFYGDITNVTELQAGTNYYAIAYAVVDGNTYWSLPQYCKPDFDNLIEY